MPEPVLEWSALSEGRVFAAVPLVLDDSRVDAYLEATGEHHPLYAHATGGGWVPPCFTTMVRFAKDALGGRWPSGWMPTWPLSTNGDPRPARAR